MSERDGARSRGRAGHPPVLSFSCVISLIPPAGATAAVVLEQQAPANQIRWELKESAVYSVRRAVEGSTPMARRAGRMQPASAAISSSSGTTRKVAESRDGTP